MTENSAFPSSACSGSFRDGTCLTNRIDLHTVPASQGQRLVSGRGGHGAHYIYNLRRYCFLADIRARCNCTLSPTTQPSARSHNCQRLPIRPVYPLTDFRLPTPAVPGLAQGAWDRCIARLNTTNHSPTDSALRSGREHGKCIFAGSAEGTVPCLILKDSKTLHCEFQDESITTRRIGFTFCHGCSGPEVE